MRPLARRVIALMAILGAVTIAPISAEAEAPPTYFENDPEEDVCIQNSTVDSLCQFEQAEEQFVSDSKDAVMDEARAAAGVNDDTVEVPLAPTLLTTEEVDNAAFRSDRNCDRRVCTNIRGSGTRVVEWWTTVNQYAWDPQICGNLAVAFKVRPASDPSQWNVWHRQRFSGCYGPPPPGFVNQFEWHAPSWRFPRRWASGTYLCNTWAPAPPLEGAPCVKLTR